MRGRLRHTAATPVLFKSCLEGLAASLGRRLTAGLLSLCRYTVAVILGALVMPVLWNGQLSRAEHLPQPLDQAVLTISGLIEHANVDGNADFDLSMLEALPQHQFETQTPWTTESHHYQGVRLSTLLAYVGAQGSKLKALALNDYRVEMDVAHLEQYPAILALKRDGSYMPVRDKGPLWILYPLSDFPELDRSPYHAYMVWQLRELQVEP